jgi:hypothetical protein
MSQYDTERGAGWIAFAGMMLLIAGVLNFIGGISAIGDANFYAADAHYQFADLNTWGWVLLILGVMQVFAGVSIWNGGAYGRFIGLISASLNAMAQLFFLPAYPFWSLALFTLDILIIYGLVAYGGRPDTPRASSDVR